jgi:hypothetical protein
MPTPTKISWLLLASVLAIGCNSKPSKAHTVIIDTGWDKDYGTNLCAAQESHTHLPCIPDGPTDARQLEINFVSAFQTNPACRDVSLIKDPATNSILEAGWSLNFNVGLDSSGVLAPADSQWQIIKMGNWKAYAEGDMANPFQESTRICTMVMGKGGQPAEKQSRAY